MLPVYLGDVAVVLCAWVKSVVGDDGRRVDFRIPHKGIRDAKPFKGEALRAVTRECLKDFDIHN